MSGEEVFLSLGGNLGDPADAMRQALHALDAHPECAVLAVSSLFRTPPWGLTDQPAFLNAAAHLRTTLSPHDFLALCLATERALKRVRGTRWGPRLIDIDILVFGERHIREEGLEIPHPRLAQRAFVLVPLAEIAPNLAIGGETVEALLARADTTGIVAEAGPEWFGAQV